jgi:hypothetical protein
MPRWVLGLMSSWSRPGIPGPAGVLFTKTNSALGKQRGLIRNTAHCKVSQTILLILFWVLPIVWSISDAYDASWIWSGDWLLLSWHIFIGCLLRLMTTVWVETRKFLILWYKINYNGNKNLVRVINQLKTTVEPDFRVCVYNSADNGKYPK